MSAPANTGIPQISQSDLQKHDEFMKIKIKEIFETYVKDGKKGVVEIKEIPYIMRYLGQFPSEAQVRDAILPEIFKDDEELPEHISLQKLETYMLKVLRDREFEPDDSEILLSAFKLLDPEGKGCIEIDTMKNFLEKQGIDFKPDETKQFIEFATNYDKQAKVFYYEDYIQRLAAFQERHMETVMKGYNQFMQKKK